MDQPKVIEATSHEEADQQVKDMNDKAWDKYASGGYKGEHPPHLEKEVVSDIASSGQVRVVATPRPAPWEHSQFTPGKPSELGVRNPFGVLGGGR